MAGRVPLLASVNGLVLTAPFSTLTSEAGITEPLRAVGHANPLPIPAHNIPVSIRVNLDRPNAPLNAEETRRAEAILTAEGLLTHA